MSAAAVEVPVVEVPVVGARAVEGPVLESASAPRLVLLPLPVVEPCPAVGVEAAPLGPPEAAAGQQVLRLEPAPAPGAGRTGYGERPVPVGPDRGLPEVRGWAGQFVQAAVEVAAGLRSPAQLTRWASDDVRVALARRGDLSRRRGSGGGTGGGTGTGDPRGRRAVVTSVRASSPVPGIAEACAVVRDGPRLRAVALRLEDTDGRWRVTALQLG